MILGLPPVNLGGWTFESLALPLGISFWTFQQINFLLERFNNRKHNLDFLSYTSVVLFFPHLIAGPIVRTSELAPQIHKIGSRARDLSSDLTIGIFLFAIGLFKKVILADNLSPIPNALFSNPNQSDVLFGWFAIVSYMLQLYCDFSGYCDMGMGLAKMFGFTFPINFNSPLRATNFVDFWRRWHITLTRFFTDTLHAPLTISLLRKFPNASENITASIPIIFTFFITGIWHGAGNQFIIFGALNGIIMAVCIIYMRYVPYSILPAPVLKMLNLLLVSFVFLFFRAPTLSVALEISYSLFDLMGLKSAHESISQIYSQFGYSRILLFFFVLYLCLFTNNVYKNIQNIFQPAGFRVPLINPKSFSIKFDLKTAIFTAIIFFISICALLNAQSSEFIYFQF
nr:MBOAT family O-acyltransferase [Polynucleobacter sp. AP-Kaivos-20-H2]